MSSLLRRAVGRRDITSIDDYIYAVNSYVLTPAGIQQTMTGGKTEPIPHNFGAYAGRGYGGNAIVFACMATRALVFSGVRFRFQRLRDGKPADMFGSQALRLLEYPQIGMTTQDLLLRTMCYADLAGNSYSVLDTPLTRLGGDDTTKNVLILRPDFMEVVITPRMRRTGREGTAQLGWERVGYVYTEGGPQSGNDPVPLMPDEVAHFMPMPDPLASFRGMSWLTPVIRELEVDGLMTRHKRKFFENGATPNMIVKHPVGASVNKVLDFRKRLAEEQVGADKAYKQLHMYPGADATVVGNTLEQIDFRNVQGANETRIAAAAGTPPVIVGLSEGLAAATYSNYSQARRRMADGTMHPLWRNVSGSFEVIMPAPDPASRLWYDTSDVPFLREDEKDQAEINFTRAQAIRQLVEAGYTPESAALVIETGDFKALEHTGLFSVQLRPPGQEDPSNDAPAALPAGTDAPAV